MVSCEICGLPLGPRATRFCGHRCSAISRERTTRGGLDLPSKECERCGDVFQKDGDWNIAHWNARRFCSLECRGNGKSVTVKQCETCGCDFVLKNWRRRFCSSSCYGISISGTTTPRTRVRKYEFSPAQRRRLLWFADHRCEKCGATENLQADHVVPRWEGGTNDIRNGQILCRPCHLAKTADDVNRYWLSRASADHVTACP